MANKRISQLPPASSPLSGDTLLPVELTTGDTKRATVDSLGFLQAGAGATLRTTQSKLREFLTPEDFGAVGNNVADDTVAMTAALNAAVSSGLRLRLRDGATYFLATWSPYSNTSALRIECASNGVATLRGPSSTVTFLSPAANFDIQGVTFSTWAFIVNRLTAQTGSFTNVVFSSNRCVGCTSIAFNIERPIENYHIEDNIFENCTGGFAIRIGTNTFAIQDTWLKGFICRNVCKTLTSTAGAAGAAFALIYGREVVISDNIIDGVQDNSGSGEAYGIYTKTRYAVIKGNIISNVNSTGVASIVGINIKGTTRSVTTSPQGFAVICFGNHVRNVGAAGVKGLGIRGQTDDVLIFGNMAEDCGGSGIAADEASSYRNVRILHNLVRYASNVAGTVGVRLEGSGFGVTAEHNTIRNAETGIRLTTGASASTMDDGQVVRNTIDGASFGIIIDAFSGCTLSRPVIEGNVFTGGTYALVNNGSGGTISNARVRFNDFARAATAAVIGSLGTSAVAEGNIGYLTASATWDPPNIANGASAATTLTVGGALLGDAVMASFSLALGGLALAAQVSAADTVEVRLLNNSGGAVDLASGTVRVRVVKGIA